MSALSPPPPHAAVVDVLAWALERFGRRVILATSLGAEDMVLLHELSIAGQRANIRPRAFFLDTGRIHEETYALLERAKSTYAVDLEVYFPDWVRVEALVRHRGPNGFRDSLEARKECCAARKTAPLARALREADASITGLRRDQSVTRTDVEVVAPDNARDNLVKISPLAHWTWADVVAHLDENDVPRSPLHARGYRSIGCAPCTRATLPDEDPRAGRWWWESAEHAEHKECGLHPGGRR